MRTPGRGRSRAANDDIAAEQRSDGYLSSRTSDQPFWFLVFGEVGGCQDLVLEETVKNGQESDAMQGLEDCVRSKSKGRMSAQSQEDVLVRLMTLSPTGATFDSV